MATSHAVKLWAQGCQHQGAGDVAEACLACAGEIDTAVCRHLWDGQWYGRGITDDGVTFGISDDAEGRVFLNLQSWAILAGTCSQARQSSMIAAIEAQLETPCGVMMLAPAYTVMRDDVGRVTRKHPGSAENGSIYNHAVAFYAYSLYQTGETDRAYRLIRQMIHGDSDADYHQRGQMPLYIPNESGVFISSLRAPQADPVSCSTPAPLPGSIKR